MQKVFFLEERLATGRNGTIRLIDEVKLWGIHGDKQRRFGRKEVDKKGRRCQREKAKKELKEGENPARSSSRREIFEESRYRAEETTPP